MLFEPRIGLKPLAALCRRLAISLGAGVDVRTVWDPVWTMDRLSESAREKLVMPLEDLEPYRQARIAQQQRGA